EREGNIVAGPVAIQETTTSTLIPTGTAVTLPGNPGANTPGLRPPSQVVVRVGKAGAPEGQATANSDKLKAAGYQSTPFDSSKTETASKVYYTAGFQGEAAEIAKTLSLPPTSVAAMPEPPPDPLNGANVLVLLAA